MIQTLLLMHTVMTVLMIMNLNRNFNKLVLHSCHIFVKDKFKVACQLVKIRLKVGTGARAKKL